MRAEHCSLGGCSFPFTTPNYNVTTTPEQEWRYIVGDDDGLRWPCPDMLHERRIVPVTELLGTKLAQRAKLSREEMIAVVLYTGPMFVVYVRGCAFARPAGFFF